MNLSAHLHEHHRNLAGGEARAAVFGISDGLASNTALIAGVAATGAATNTVLAAGIAGLLAGAMSMATGEWVSMRAHADLVHTELAKERAEILRNPAGEHAELTDLLASRGVRSDAAADVAAELMIDADVAVDSHARIELGVDPDNTGSAFGAAAASFAAFAVGAAIPLAPWAVTSGGVAAAVSLTVALCVAVAVGAVIGRLSHQRTATAVGRQVAALTLTVAATTLIGAVFGVTAA